MGSEHADALARCEAARGDFVTAARALLAPDGDNDADTRNDTDTETPWFAVIPLVVGGLFLAGAVGLLARMARRH
ncbi:hypothetical protein ACWDRX_33810, partial [Streptomyces nigra]